jgi:hypothetical protein
MDMIIRSDLDLYVKTKIVNKNHICQTLSPLNFIKWNTKNTIFRGRNGLGRLENDRTYM